MAIQPYRQQIGVPNEAGGGVQQVVDARVFDIGQSIQRIGDTLQRTFAPILEREAQIKAQDNAGMVVFKRDEQGNLVVPERAQDGGLIYRQAFDRIVEARYLNEVGSEFQSFLDTEQAERRIGNKPFDPIDYAATIDAKQQGMLDGMAPRLRAQAEELFEREAMERKRAFVNEYSRTKQIQLINGINDQNRFFLQRLANFRDEGLTHAEAIEKYAAPLTENMTRLRELGFAGGEEAEAIFMARDNLTDGIERYETSIEKVLPLLPAMGGMDDGDLGMIELWLDGVPVEGALAGTVRNRTGATEVVNPDLITNVFTQAFGIKPNQVARDPNSALGRANPDSYHIQGRAIDSPRIPGMTFDQYVKWWQDQGFTVVQAIDEYKNPSAHATGGHWHVAFGNKREVISKDKLEGMEGYTFETFNDLDPSVKQTVRGLIAQRRQAIRIEEAEAREDLRNQLRIEAEAREQQLTRQTIEGAMAGGTGGNWSASERGYMEEEVRQVVDFSRLRDSFDERNKLLSYIQQRNYLPKASINFIDNMIRSNDWEGALELYRGLQGATLGQSGSRVGDLLLSQLDSKTAALLQRADSLARTGQSYEQISVALENARSGQGFTVKQAEQAFNTRFADDGKKYTIERSATLRSMLGLRSNATLDPVLIRDMDNAFAANLEITGNPETALQLAANQVKGRYQRDDKFAQGYGPSVLSRTYTNRQIMDFLQTETTTDGQPLLRRVSGKTHTFGGRDSSIFLQPIDSERDGIGRYRVMVFEPGTNRTNLIDQFDVDLGRYLREFHDKKNPNVTITRAQTIQRTRESRERQGQSAVERWATNPAPGM